MAKTLFMVLRVTLGGFFFSMVSFLDNANAYAGIDFDDEASSIASSFVHLNLPSTSDVSSRTSSFAYLDSPVEGNASSIASSFAYLNSPSADDASSTASSFDLIGASSDEETSSITSEWSHIDPSFEDEAFSTASSFEHVDSFSDDAGRAPSRSAFNANDASSHEALARVFEDLPPDGSHLVEQLPSGSRAYLRPRLNQNGQPVSDARPNQNRQSAPDTLPNQTAQPAPNALLNQNRQPATNTLANANRARRTLSNLYGPDMALNLALGTISPQWDVALLVPPASSLTPLPPRQIWVRTFQQNNTNAHQTGPLATRSQGKGLGLQLGMDLLSVSQHRIGVYGSTVKWRHTVFTRSQQNRPLGWLHGQTDYAGLYWTYHALAGWSSTVMLQQGWQQGHSYAHNNHKSKIHGRSRLASFEISKPSALTSRWRIEPQLQIIALHPRFGSTRHATLPKTIIRTNTSPIFIGRGGVRLQADYFIQPYLSVNLWHGLAGTHKTVVHGPVGTAIVATQRGHTSGELVAGTKRQLNRRVALYGEYGRTFPLAGAQRISTQHNLVAGLNIAW